MLNGNLGYVEDGKDLTIFNSKVTIFHVEPHLVSFCDNGSVLDSAYPSLGSAGRLGRKRVKVVSAKKKHRFIVNPQF